jgi:hypothetical protein
MHTRRGVLAVAGATVLAGCSSSTQSASQQSETTNETQSQADEPDLTAGEIHDNWVDVEQQAYVPAVEAASEAYDQGLENDGLHAGLYQAVDAANQKLGGRSSSYLEQHHNMIRAIDEAIPDDHQLYSTLELGKTSKYTQIDEFPVTRIWLEEDAEEDGDTIDIVAALSPETGQPTHLKNTEPEYPSTGLQELLSYRDPENFGTHGPHDIEAMRETTEYLKEERNKSFDEEEIEDANGSWLERFESLYWADGMAVPVQDNWETYHDDFHSVHPEVNRQMANTDDINEGDVAAFTVDDGDVTLYSTVEGYDPEQDGMPTMEEVTEI